MSETFKWGVIGPGRIAHKFAKAIEVVENTCLHAVASRNQSRASEFASAYQSPIIYDNYEALAHDPDVDAIYIATPHNFHFDQTALCLNAGKAVLCEKPMTTSLADTETLILLSQSTQTFLMEGLWTYYLPIYQTIKQWIADGEIGQIQGMQSSFGFSAPFDPQGRLFNPSLAGGALYDIGLYNIALSQWVMHAQPQHIEARAYIGSTGVDEQLYASLHYADGVTSQLTASLRGPLENSFFIYGDQGYIQIPQFWMATTAKLIKTERGKREETNTVTLPFEATGLEYEIRFAMSKIQKGQLLTDTALQTTRNLQETIERTFQALKNVS